MMEISIGRKMRRGVPGALRAINKKTEPIGWFAVSNAFVISVYYAVVFAWVIMMAIVVAYGSFLNKESNIAKDAMIIAFSDFAISVLSGIVLFTTMSGTGQLGNLTASGIGTAFIVYPQSIVLLTNSGVANAIFAFVFYFCLCTLAIDSAFSIIEGVSTAIADAFRLSHKKTTIAVCIVASVLSLWFTTGAGLAWLDIVDNWCNAYSLILVGILEAIAIGWLFVSSLGLS